MKLLSFKASNLFSLDFVQVDLDQRGLVLITGHSSDEGSANGSGKSSLANKGIVWTLFGQTAGGTKGDDVINSRATSDECYGEIIFRSANGELCLVHRSRKPAGLALRKFSTLEEELVDLSLKTQAETQLLINQELGRDFKSFIQTDFFGQGREKSFLALSPAHQTELLEQILPIEDLSKWVKYAKEEQKKLKDQISKVEGETNYTKGSVHQMTRFLHDLRGKITQFDISREAAILQRQKDLSDYEQAVAQKKQRLEIVRHGLDQLPVHHCANVDAVKKHYDGFTQSIREARANLTICQSTDQQLKLERESTSAKLMDIDVTCPTCNQPLAEDVRDSLLMQQHEIRGKLAQLDGDLKNVNVALKGWNHHISDLDSQQECAKGSYDNIVTVLNQRNTLTVEITALEDEIDPSKYTAIVTELDQLEATKNPHEKELQDKEEQASIMNVKLRCLEEKLNKLNEEYEHLSFWTDTFGKNFKNFLFKRACPFLQSRAAHHLCELGNEQLKVEFSTSKTLKSGDEKSGFSVLAYSEMGGKGFDNLSGGEQQIVSFAVGLALADLAETQAQGPSHFLILDEPFMALDDRNCENLVNYLSNELSYRRETILLISNEDNLKSLIPERIHVEKTGGITRVKF